MRAVFQALRAFAGSVNSTTYTGRFAPSPSGPLHLGSVIAAAASYLDARAHHGQWLIRIEDIDPPREVAGASSQILQSLNDLHMRADGPVLWQRERIDEYLAALNQLRGQGNAYPCTCSRKGIARVIAAQRNIDAIPTDQLGNLIYPGTCRPEKSERNSRFPIHADENIAWRLAVGDALVTWQDRPAGFARGHPQSDHLAQTVGDFIIRRRDQLWSYQLAVVVDDAFSGVTDIVRGADLADSTARQILLRDLLNLPAVRTLHFPVLNDAAGKKVSKQTGAPAADTSGSEAQRIALLNHAIEFLNLSHIQCDTLDEFWSKAITLWRQSFWMQT